MSEASSEANEADVQEQQQTVPPESGPDLDRLERDLGDDGSSADVVEQSQD